MSCGHFAHGCGWRRWLCPPAGLRVAQGAKPAHGKKLSKCAQGGLGCRDCQGSRVIEDQGTSVGWESCPAAPRRVDGVMGECTEGAEAVSYLSHLPSQQPAESLRGHPGRQEVAGHQVGMLPNDENS